MQNSTSIKHLQPSLPKGGGSLSGMGESLSAVGPDGSSSFTVPLPISVGRGYAPELELSYSSASGNGPFGMGWDCFMPSFSLRTTKGVPQYAGKDEFIGPDGEVLDPVLDVQGNPIYRVTLMGNMACRVTLWQSRIVCTPVRLEYWRPLDPSDEQPFWVMLTPDGQRHLFGRTYSARISDPQDSSHIAVWLLEESVNSTGEHIHYIWREEDDVGCNEDELVQHQVVHSGRYLAKVSYGNIQADHGFMLSEGDYPADTDWLFHLVFDYGERSSSLNDVPPYASSGSWLCRPDSRSHYNYGFEVRTRRLCRQVLMYHRLGRLSGQIVDNEEPFLVSRLILEYDLNARASLMISLRQMSHDVDGSVVALAPLEFDYQRFISDLNTDWQEVPQLGNFNAYQPWQMVDLYGEGIPGLLFQDVSGAWWYKEPIRETLASNSNAVTYSRPSPMPRIPSLQADAVLMDINGDGSLEWVVATSDIQGYHTMLVERTWTAFIPFSAVPLEYFHPQVQFADITGAGLPDLILIGPRSVRFWASEREYWSSDCNVEQISRLPLPIPGHDERSLVVFSDMTGSGQSHLTEIREDMVRYWPNLGHGVFGKPVIMKGFHIDNKMFSPERLYMADLDGSGTSDIIYAHHDYLELYLNESGNHFTAPIRVELPSGIVFDDTCRLQVADIQGLGISSILLTLPHMVVQHWRLDLVTHKPLLLNRINNNMGADTSLDYRSSAQFWLDDKRLLIQQGHQAVSYLPFPVHLLWRTVVQDEISGNCLSSLCVYRHGAWDGREQEFRGFGCIEQVDLDVQSSASQEGIVKNSVPARKVSWFITGIDAIDRQLPKEFWDGDKKAFPVFTSRFTRFGPETNQDIVFTPDQEQRYWLTRALKGTFWRSELYGEESSDQGCIPYTITESRSQARLLTEAANGRTSIMISVIESRTWTYEQVASDPQCTQQIVLRLDENGFPYDRLEIAYPRRDKPDISPYPNSLPETLFDSCYDAQQQILRITRSRNTNQILSGSDVWMPNLVGVTRTDINTFEASKVPATGITLEWCLESEQSSLLACSTSSYAGHSRVVYTGEEGEAVFPPLVAWTEVADMDNQALTAFDGIFSVEEVTELLMRSGRFSVNMPFEDGGNVYVSRQGLQRYAGKMGFYRPLNQRQSELTGYINLEWDTHYCAVISTIDAAGLCVNTEYDYRFLLPWKIIDENDNITLAHYDALGRIVSTRFSGMENGLKTGYTLPEDETIPFVEPVTVEEALSLVPGIPVASVQVYCPLSWMYQNTQTRFLYDSDVLTEDGYITRLAWYRQYGRDELPHGVPPHMMFVTTDRYDTDLKQQLRQSLSFSDGFGRLLQKAIRHEAGEAWLRSDNGDLIADEMGPISTKTDFRWAVTGRIEYNSKGMPARVYQPYFLNSWEYVRDDCARRDLFADTYYYDPVGREIRVVTAKGWLRRSFYTPWFVANDDENDTLGEGL